MPNDQQLIRDLISRWHAASSRGDWAAVVPLMAPDVVFLIPGQPPMRGREAFLAAVRNMSQQGRIESSAEVQEIEVAGEWAYGWTQLSVTMIQRRAQVETRRSGYTLSIFRKNPDGSWVLFRDANLLATEPAASDQ